ncbi:hypothetical protein ABG768_027291, partial [Culter alburnus]
VLKYSASLADDDELVSSYHCLLSNVPSLALLVYARMSMSILSLELCKFYLFFVLTVCLFFRSRKFLS